MPSKSNDRLFWADRKNRLEKSRLDLVIRRFDREKISLNHEIEREKRIVVKNFGNVRRTTGVSDQGVPPENEDDVEFMNAPNYKMGIRLSEHRLLEWRGSEKHLAKVRAHAEYELLKSAGLYRHYSASDGSGNTHLKSRATRSAPSIGIELRRISRNADDEVFYNGDRNSVSSPRMARVESVLNLDVDELEKRIVQDYKSMFHNTQIPPTSQFSKPKNYRQTKSENGLKEKESKLRPQTSLGTSHSKRKSKVADDFRRPATAQNNYKVVKDKSGKSDETKSKEILHRDKLTPKKPMMNNFMDDNVVNESQTLLRKDSDDVEDSVDGLLNDSKHKLECCDEDKELNQSVLIENNEMNSENEKVQFRKKHRQLMLSEEQDNESMETQNAHRNDKNTVINCCEDNEQITKPLREQNTVQNVPKSDDPSQTTISSDRLLQDTNDSTGNTKHVKVSVENQNERNVPMTSCNNSPDGVDGKIRKLSSPRTKPRRTIGLGGIMEDKMLQLENQNGVKTIGDDVASQTTMNTISRISSSRQRRTSITSTASSDRYSYLFGSMSDVSIGSDGQRRPSKWREIVKAEATPVPESKKIVSVTTVVRAALAFSKTARKRALDKLVEEQSADPRELIRRERLRRLQSRNSVLMSIADQWTVKEEEEDKHVKPPSVYSDHI